jgi:hypothetical protein
MTLLSTDVTFLVILSFLVIYTVYAFRDNLSGIKEYFLGSRKGLGILKGIAIVMLVVFLTLVIAPRAFSNELEVKYFSYVELYFGIDNVKGLSSQCVEGGLNDKLTSNVGAKINFVEWKDSIGVGYVNGKYTHHSCAFNQDRNTYDAFGLEGGYRFDTSDTIETIKSWFQK